eukprot:3052422-Prymnesium_polylepis.1
MIGSERRAGCRGAQTPRVGYDMPGQGKATMEFIVRMYAMRLAKRRICVNAVSPGYTDTKEWARPPSQTRTPLSSAEELCPSS